YAADPDQLSLLATFPRFRELERRHGSLTAGITAQRRRGSSNPQRTKPLFVTLKPGLSVLIEALRAQLHDVTVIMGQPVVRLARQNTASPYRLRLADGSLLEADAVVLTTPAYVTAELLEPLSFKAAALLAEIHHVSTAVVTLAFQRSQVEHPLDGTGFVVPRLERRPLMGSTCTWTSSKWPGLAPEGFALLRCFFGRAGQEDILQLDDRELLHLAYQELRSLVGLRGEPILTRVYRWPRAMPQYPVGHLQRLAQLEAALSEHPGLVLAGAAYRGIGLPDCVKQAQESAEQVLARIGNRSAVR
ncbi:MAG: protoporphyrinogen oxidase, partial [Anaerolineae bacterium]|nr:protoporphyrinogen oxidase [Anaerolineae bacterium]